MRSPLFIYTYFTHATEYAICFVIETLKYNKWILTILSFILFVDDLHGRYYNEVLAKVTRACFATAQTICTGQNTMQNAPLFAHQIVLSTSLNATNQYPFGRFKGSDMLLLTRWIRHIVGHGLVFEADILRSGRSLIHGCSPSTKEILQKMFGAAGGALDFFHDLHTSGIWLPPNVSSKMAESCLQFCEGYEALARHCYNLGLCRYHLEPSLHGFLHFHFDLRDRQCMALNPAVHSCEADEDFVGKVSRLARCVHAATTTIRVIDRILIKTYFELEEPDL